MMQPSLMIDGRQICESNPTYFIADIAANHDGDIERAKDLIYLAKEAGAEAAKFQHFKAEKIVSDFGFKTLGSSSSHQGKWAKSVFEVYREASVDEKWTHILKETCDKAGITFFTSPYDLEMVNHIDPYVPAYKIGSGDITWLEIIEHIASKGKPYLLATGASSIEDVLRAVEGGLEINPQMALLQCNTNYTGSVENMKYLQLNVLRTYQTMFPGLVLGLSDHTPGHSSVLGAVALGARIVEKHFTDDVNRQGPDHAFSMNPSTWSLMVACTRELEAALGGGIKRVEANERDTVILQRRAIRARKPLNAGNILNQSDVILLRPCPADAMPPYLLSTIMGGRLRRNIAEGDYLRLSDFDLD